MPAMLNRTVVLFLAAAMLSPAIAQKQERQASPEGARVYFIDLADGAKVSSPFVVRFGLFGMGVAPAGIKLPNTGHHHLLIDAALPEDLSAPLPMTDNYRHFGGGQTEVGLELPKGEHTLQLMLGDYLHIAHEPPVVSEVITVIVE
jgi:hypothetical protein